MWSNCKFLPKENTKTVSLNERFFADFFFIVLFDAIQSSSSL